jgi:hypothetical protein
MIPSYVVYTIEGFGGRVSTKPECQRKPPER